MSSLTSKKISRKLTAILSADAVGSSRLMNDDEEAAIKTLNACRELRQPNGNFRYDLTVLWINATDDSRCRNLFVRLVYGLECGPFFHIGELPDRPVCISKMS